ncbi:Adenylate and Guanylate cyclase catalytic domain containing protein [Tritrichomonas foetus]|uniref:Adenylate and Guanylate cyclase catalytic domain containing protein n=1 Tax=Tritrichomonas foetus TaxID=1144522 RepID=A0A1J4K1S5_9EUKA|nr:Adenylate and Guanylate cyclase catalytic domain containing protein [Tritrichomonas foetus]|eukprot:OHT03692.1 Adenylate and Guanylate cyclase catalytic domain containing protein [Tritrichomonas foetus]
MNHPSATATVSGTAIAPSFTYSSGYDKYNGLIRQSYLKTIRKDLISLFAHVYSVVPNSNALCVVITIARLLQLTLPSLYINDKSLWPDGLIDSNTVRILSIVYQLIPSQFQMDAFLPIAIICIVINAVIMIIVVVSSYYLKSKGKLPSQATYIISIFYGSIEMFFPPVTTNILFRGISDLIFIEHESSYIVRNILLIIIAFVLSMFNLFVFILICSESIAFRKTSLCSVLNVVQVRFWMGLILITGLTSLSVDASKIVKIVFSVLVFLVYLASNLLPFYGGSLIYLIQRSALFASVITGTIFSLISTIFIALEKEYSLIIFGVAIVVFVLVYFIFNVIQKKIENKWLQILDDIVDDVNSFDGVKNQSIFFLCATVGMRNNHPICLNWQFFKLGVERWEKSDTIWFMFTKFVAIYPEEEQMLTWIFRTILSTRIHGSSARCMKQQIAVLLKTREINLSIELKGKIAGISRQVVSAKHKLRHIWDLVIQGNVGEIEEESNRTWKAIHQTQAEFQHLVKEYPNNRFVLRSYARFVSELISDKDEANDLIEKVRLVQRGVQINPDEYHQLGLAAFPTLPLYLSMMKKANDMYSDTSVIESTELEKDDTNGNEVENGILKEKIRTLSIPAVRCAIVTRLLFLIVLYIIPVIVIIVLTNNYLNKSTVIIEHMYNLAFLRTLTYQVTGFSHRYILEAINELGPLKSNEEPPTSLGSTHSTVDQVIFLLAELSTMSQQVSSFKSYSSSSQKIVDAKSLIFDAVTPYWYYVNPFNYTPIDQNVQTCLINYYVELSDLKNMEIEKTIVNTSTLLNPCFNSDAITASINSALALMTESLDEIYERDKIIQMITFYVILVVVIIAYVVSITVQVIWIKKTKEETYRCLTSLPKATVSNLVENLRVLKKDTTENSSTIQNTEISRQEENILKIFNTGGSGYSSSVADSAILIVTEVIIIILYIISAYMLSHIMPKGSQSILEFAPHLDYLMGAYSNSITMLFSVNLALSAYSEENAYIILWEGDGNLGYFYLRLSQSREYYFKARYGGSLVSESPFQGFASALEHSSEMVNCTDKYAIPTTFLDTVSCYDANTLFTLIPAVMDSEIHAYRTIGIPLHGLDEIWSDTWSLMVTPIYDTFFHPMFETIIPTITDQLESIKTSNYPLVSVLLFVGIISECIAIYDLFNIDRHIRLVLSFLLHCPIQVVLQSQKIMKILSGNFKQQKSDKLTRDADFFNDVLKSLPDAVFVADQSTFQIETANTSCERIFGKDEFIGKNIKELFGNFEGGSKLFATTQPKELVIKNADGAEVNISALCSTINNKVTVVCRDITSTIRYNSLITAERNRSDGLLNSILPANLVQRVQAGEKTISFEVQSASILFMDIVSFTPWCSALPASHVMSTLNSLFKKFDASLAKHATMTKIKCIGDCYMTGGGIFDSVNQPAVHAKETVSFGLDAISNIEELNKERGEKLQMRVGVNTGGPIVAGVLGVGKPTFEILGPAINMAQQMEHNGVPMMVHISRSVYELIYGDTFDIKERGTIEVKGKPVITYLVSCKT